MVDNALLYFRTLSTRAIDGGFSNPEDLPTTQKILFTPPADLSSGLDDIYENNIVKKVPPKPFGRTLIQTDEGFKNWEITLQGNFAILLSSSADKLHSFMVEPQGDSYHTFGKFGILYPNGPTYLNKDATDTQGFMLTRRIGKHIGITKEIFDFAVGVSFGGVIT